MFSFFFSSRRRHTRWPRDWSSDVCSSDLGTDKGDPAEHAHTLKTRPWTVAIEGEVKKPLTLGVDDLLKLAPMEERVYRLRCVEGWSMVIPWIGYSLSELIRKA